MIEYVTGNLLDADLPAIAHGCNTRGIMGSGIAKEIKTRYPIMHDIYQRMCQEGYFYLGSFYQYTHDDDYTIFNLATQVETGPNADLIAIAVSVRRMLTMALHDDIPVIGLPRIGAGIGRLKWVDVEHALEVASAGSTTKLIVFTLPNEVEKFCPRDHQKLCCPVHHSHVTPHVGCILR